jgi:hypothetical protein
VPLSEDEQRILHEIERQFYEQDPAFARQVGSTTVYSHAGRNLKWAAAGFAVGLVVMLFSFATSLVLGVIGFGVMFACAVVFERNLRRMGKAGWSSLTVPGGGLKSSFGSARQRFRDRFKRDGDAPS